MLKAIPQDEAKKIEKSLIDKGFDIEIGYDKEGLLHILCDIDDEHDIMSAIDELKLPFEHFYWLGSYASDAIVEDLAGHTIRLL